MLKNKTSKPIKVVDIESAQLIGPEVSAVVQYDESNKDLEIILFIIGCFIPLVMWVFVCCIGATSKIGRTLRTVGIVLTVLQALGIVAIILTGVLAAV